MIRPPNLLIRPIRPAQGSLAARAAMKRAQDLACLVRDESTDGIGAYLDDLTTAQMYALVTTLAAMVPLDMSINELLDWISPDWESVA